VRETDKQVGSLGGEWPEGKRGKGELGKPERVKATVVQKRAELLEDFVY